MEMDTFNIFSVLSRVLFVLGKYVSTASGRWVIILQWIHIKSGLNQWNQLPICYIPCYQEWYYIIDNLLKWKKIIAGI